MQEITISRFIGHSKSNLNGILSSNSLENVIVGSYLLDKLSKNDIKGLKSEDTRVLVVLDYLNSSNITEVASNFSKDRFAKDVSEAVLTREKFKKKGEENSFQASTPEKQIAALAYLSFLKNEQSKTLAERSESKDDLKRVYCFDYLYNLLNPKRKNKLRYEGSISDIVIRTAELYVNQLLAEKIGKENRDFELLLNDVKRYDICIDYISKARKLRGSIDELFQENSSDEEVITLLETGKNLLERINDSIKGKVEGKFIREYQSLQNEFKIISKRSYLEDKEFRKLKEINSETEKLFELLHYTGHDGAKTVNKLLQDEEAVLQQYKEFEKEKERFDMYIRETQTNIYNTEKLSFTSFFTKKPNFDSIDELTNLEKRTGKLKREMERASGNKYLLNYLRDQKTMGTFYSLAGQKADEALEILKGYREIVESKYNSCKDSIFKFLFLSRLERKLNKVRDYENKLKEIRDKRI